MAEKLTDNQRNLLRQLLDDEQDRRVSYGPHRGNALIVHGLQKRGLMERYVHYGSHRLRLTEAGRAAASAAHPAGAQASSNDQLEQQQ